MIVLTLARSRAGVLVQCMNSWASPTKFNFAVAAQLQGQASVGLAGSDSCPSCRPRAGPHRHHRRRVFGLTRVPLLICVVVVGSALPVTPLRTPADAIAGGPGAQIRRVCSFALFTDKVTVRSCGAGHREPALGRWPSRQGDRGQGRLARSPCGEGPGCQLRSRCIYAP